MLAVYFSPIDSPTVSDRCHTPICLLDDSHHLASFDVVGMSDAFVERYERLGRTVDPVVQYVLENHALAHEEIVLPTGIWKVRN